VGRISQAPPVDAGMIKSQLGRWIIDTRTVYTDASAGQNILTEAYNWVDRQSDAVDQIETYTKANNPYLRAAKETVGVAIESVGQIGNDTWSVDFNEEKRTKDGGAPITTYWRATIRIKISPPTDDATIMANPTGVYVTWFKVTPRMGR
jgi:type IV secretion system protein TrbF